MSWSRRRLSILAAAILPIGAVIIALASSHNPSPQAPDYTDLVLSLRFENDTGGVAFDSSRYRHDGTIMGATAVEGKIGRGLQFDGVDDYVSIPHAQALSPTNAITVMAWVYLDSSTSSSKILQKRGVFSDRAGGYMLGAWFGNPRGYAFEVYDSEDTQHLVKPSPEALPIKETWTHVAATFDGSTIKLYENGQLKGTTSWSGTIGSSTKDLYIGIQPDNMLMPFKGKLDEMRIYNRALSETEVACAYNGTFWLQCTSGSANPPVVTTMGVPTALMVGESGTWTVGAYNPEGGALTFRANWGDGSQVEEVASNALRHSATFQHTYASAGSYPPSFTVVANSGLSSPSVAASTVTVTPREMQVSGSLMESVTWQRDRSPYIVTDDVTVFPGAVLTVEPGVEVRFANGKKLEVRGNLIAEGTDAARIIFTSNTTPPTKGLWNGIYVANQQGGRASLKFATISYATSALSVECCHSGGPVTVADSTFRENLTALSGYAGWKTRVDRTTFENNSQAVTSADKDIYDSTFRNNTYGLYQTERISVYQSTFTGHQIAAWGGRGDFKQNTVTNNETGVQAFFEGWKTTYNTITTNGIGIIVGQYDSTTPEIAYNNIHGNTIYDVKVTGASNKTAANNWWGTTETAAIDAKVYDGRDNASLGLLTYMPVLTQAVDITTLTPPAPIPTPPPTSTPTPTPVPLPPLPPFQPTPVSSPDRQTPTPTPTPTPAQPSSTQPTPSASADRQVSTSLLSPPPTSGTSTTPSSRGGGGGGAPTAVPIRSVTSITPLQPTPSASPATSMLPTAPTAFISRDLILERGPAVVDSNVAAINERAKLISQERFDAVLVELNELRNVVKEQQAQIRYLETLKENVAELNEKVEKVITNFITYGVDANTQKLGEGERAAVLHSYKSAFGKLPETEQEVADAVKIANGRFPEARSVDAEQRAAATFRKVYRREQDTDNPNDSAAIAIMAYGLRQKAENRNIASERAAIRTFQRIYRKSPQSTHEWNALQAITYSGAKR